MMSKFKVGDKVRAYNVNDSPFVASIKEGHQFKILKKIILISFHQYEIIDKQGLTQCVSGDNLVRDYEGVCFRCNTGSSKLFCFKMKKNEPHVYEIYDGIGQNNFYGDIQANEIEVGFADGYFIEEPSMEMNTSGLTTYKLVSMEDLQKRFPCQHPPESVIVNSANGTAFRYCRECKEDLGDYNP
jgi:hypothetical protein